ncbi:MAG: hypothetical protein E7L05_02585 [Clostridium sp.]|nr:hypothetical protein [Clostridium sp.]
MEILNNLINDSTSSWIDALPTYQKNKINELLEKGYSTTEVAELWLSASPKNIAPFGTEKGNNIFLEKIKEEFEGLLCGDSKYDSYRSKLSNEVTLSKGYVIGFISSAIAPFVGTSGTFIAPIVALLLVGMRKVTLNAWCKCCKEKKITNSI